MIALFLALGSRIETDEGHDRLSGIAAHNNLRALRIYRLGLLTYRSSIHIPVYSVATL